MSDDARFRSAVRRMHQEEDAAYGNAWKRRGERLKRAITLTAAATQAAATVSGEQPCPQKIMKSCDRKR